MALLCRIVAQVATYQKRLGRGGDFQKHAVVRVRQHCRQGRRHDGYPSPFQIDEQIVGSVFHVTQAALPALERSGGTILNIASSAALQRTTHHWLPYVAAKSALLAMSRNLAQELGPRGITVNTLSPSLVDTDLVAGTPERVRQAMVSRTPLRRLANPDDVAGAALMLVSGHAAFVTGANLLVTGGETMI